MLTAVFFLIQLIIHIVNGQLTGVEDDNQSEKQWIFCPGDTEAIGPCLYGLCPDGYDCLHDYCCEPYPEDTTPNFYTSTTTELPTPGPEPPHDEDEEGGDLVECNPTTAIGPCIGTKCPLGHNCYDGNCCETNIVKVLRARKAKKRKRTTTVKWRTVKNKKLLSTTKKPKPISSTTRRTTSEPDEESTTPNYCPMGTAIGPCVKDQQCPLGYYCLDQHYSCCPIEDEKSEEQKEEFL